MEKEGIPRNKPLIPWGRLLYAPKRIARAQACSSHFFLVEILFVCDFKTILKASQNDSLSRKPLSEQCALFEQKNILKIVKHIGYSIRYLEIL